MIRRAANAPLRIAAKGTYGASWKAVERCLSFMHDVINIVGPRTVSLRRPSFQAHFARVYTDASFRGLGIVVLIDNVAFWAATLVTPSLQDRWALTDIGGLEGLAAVCGVLFLTSVSSATDLSIYVDNMEIASNLVSGYSSREVLVCLMLEFYLQIAARPGSLWVEWVPSEANIADIPSRHPLETDLAPFVDAPELKGILGAANRRPFVFPTHSSLWTALPPASLASAGVAGGTGLPGGKEGFEPEPPGPQTGASP